LRTQERNVSDYRFASDLIVEMQSIVQDILQQEIVKGVFKRHPEWRHLSSGEFNVKAFGMISNELISTHPRTAGEPYTLRGKCRALYDMDVSATTNVLLYSDLACLHEKETEAVNTVRKDRNDDAHSLKNFDYYKLLGTFSNAINLAREFGYTFEAKRLEEITNELHNRRQMHVNATSKTEKMATRGEKRRNWLVLLIAALVLLATIGLLLFPYITSLNRKESPDSEYGATIFTDEYPQFVENDIYFSPNIVQYQQKSGILFARMFVANGYSDRAITAINVESLVLSDGDAVLACGGAGLIDNIVIEPNDYIILGFRFEGDALNLRGSEHRVVTASWSGDFTSYMR